MTATFTVRRYSDKTDDLVIYQEDEYGGEEISVKGEHLSLLYANLCHPIHSHERAVALLYRDHYISSPHDLVGLAIKGDGKGNWAVVS